MFRQRIKHYHQWLCSAIHLETKIGQSSPIHSGYKALHKEQALTSCIQSVLSKNAIERVENVKSRVLQSPVSSPQASSKVEASDRPKQAQRLPTCRKAQNGNTRVHQGLSDSRGMGVIDRLIRRLPSHPHPHPSCRSIYHSSEPQTATVRVSSLRQNAWDIDALNINWSGLTAYAYHQMALLHRVIQKTRQCNCLIIVIAPGWPGMPWFWDLVQLSTEIPLQLPVSTTLLKQSHNYVFHSNPQHLNLHAWCLGVDNSKNKAYLWRWQRELLLLRGHQQEPSINQRGPYLKHGAEKIQWISRLL